jgi:hypothetical protein
MDLTNSNINFADHVVLAPTNRSHSLDDHVVSNCCKSMPSEQEKGARRLALRSRVNQSAGSSTGVANGGVAIAGEASVAGGVSIAA